MKRIFSVELESAHLVSVDIEGRSHRLRQCPTYECVAETGVEAIRRALAQARRDYNYRGQWIVNSLRHRGPAV
jgi:hypothetical protein